MSISPVTKKLHNNFSLSPTESNTHSEFGISQRVSTINLANTSTPSSDTFRSASATLDTNASSDRNTVEGTAVMAAPPPSQKPTMAASTGDTTPPPSNNNHHNGNSPTSTNVSANADATSSAAADRTKAKNQNLHRNVYISGIPTAYRSEEFRQLCMQFGRVEAAKLCVDNRHAPTKAYGFALYYSEESAAAAIRGLNGSFLQGRCVQARLADSHATPQPLGDAGSALNTTIPPPANYHRRCEQQNGRRGSNGAQRKGRNNSNNTNSNNDAGGVPRDVSPVNINGMTNPGMPATLPGQNFVTMRIPAPLITTGPALPMDLNAYYPFMTMMTAAAPSLGTSTMTNNNNNNSGSCGIPTPPPLSMPASNASAVQLGSAAGATTRSLSPGTDNGGFGPIGTPVSTTLSSQNNNAAATAGGGTNTAVSSHRGFSGNAVVSPSSMTLSPPLLSLHLTDSPGSQSPNTSRVAATVVNNNINSSSTNTNTTPTAAPTMAGMNAVNMTTFLPPGMDMTTSPFPVQFTTTTTTTRPPPPPLMPNQTATVMTTTTNADGTQTVVYYTVPSNTFPAPGGMMPQTMMTMAGVPAPKVDNSMIYFTMSPQPPQQQQHMSMQFQAPPPQHQTTFLTMASPQMSGATMQPAAMSGNYVMFDNNGNNNNNIGMQYQVLQ